MRTIRTLLLLSIIISMPACVTYHGVAKVGDQVYLTGTEGAFIFSRSWVKRCVELEKKLYCEELPVVSPQKTRAAIQQSTTTPTAQDPLEEEPAETGPETDTSLPTPPYPLPVDVPCQKAAELLCTCTSENMTVHSMVCQRARQAVSDYHNNETMCLNLVRPMFPLAGCLPPSP